jgi:Transcriptional regulators
MSEDERNSIEEWNNVFHILMRAVVHDMQNRLQSILDGHSLSKVHIAYLIALDAGNTTLKSLSDHLGMDKANTTRAINGLRKEGIVEDDRQAENSRKYNVFLTEKGKGLVKELKTELSRAYDQYMKDISPEEMRHTLEILDRIRKNVESSK